MQKPPVETHIVSVPAFGIEIIIGRVPGRPWEVWDAGHPRPRKAKRRPRGSAPVAAFVRAFAYARPARPASGKGRQAR